MTAGLPVFETTIQETNHWLKMVGERLQPCDRQQAYIALRAVLQAIRDRLPTDAVLALSAQLPMLVRGFFLEGWRPGHPPPAGEDPEAFHALVAERLPPAFPRQANEAADVVYSVLADHIDPNEMDKMLSHLPAKIRPAFASWTDKQWAWLAGSAHQGRQPDV